MNGLVERLQANDPDLQTLALTSECEGREELEAFLAALETNSTVEIVVFRESFFPLRRIRQHLTSADFICMLEGVGKKASASIYIPSTMPGMVRGQLAAYTLFNTEHFTANEAITFAMDSDVVAFAEKLGSCQSLECLQLGDSYFIRSRPVSMDPIFYAAATLPNLQHLELSSHPEQRLKSFVISPEALWAIVAQAPSLQTLSLPRLGLVDEHFQCLNGVLSNSQVTQLCLDGNRPTKVGVEALLDALQNNHRLASLSLQDTDAATKANWLRIFPSNLGLQEIEMSEGLTKKVGSQLVFWLQLNVLRRSMWLEASSQISSALWPLVLEQATWNPSALWYLVRSFPDKAVG